MRADVARDLSDSALDFERVVWPKISRWLGGGEVRPVESVTSEGFQKELDTLAGIDAWHVLHNENAIRGIASRVQWADTAWNTFTIRLSRHYGQSTDTEYRKRLHALQNAERGFLLPHVTTQAYVAHPKGEGELLSVAMVRTAELFKLARAIHEDGAYKSYLTLNGVRRTAGEEFLWIHWKLFAIANVPIKQWPDAESGEGRAAS